jgi:hypothetical protein
MVTGPFANLSSQKTPLQDGIEAIGALERLVKGKNIISITYNHVAKNIMAGGRCAGTAANGG